MPLKLTRARLDPLTRLKEGGGEGRESCVWAPGANLANCIDAIINVVCVLNDDRAIVFVYVSMLQKNLIELNRASRRRRPDRWKFYYRAKPQNMPQFPPVVSQSAETGQSNIKLKPTDARERDPKQAFSNLSRYRFSRLLFFFFLTQVKNCRRASHGRPFPNVEMYIILSLR